MHKRGCLMQTLVRPGLKYRSHFTGQEYRSLLHRWITILEIQTRDISTPPSPPPQKNKRASIQIQGCALALPSSQWYLTFALIQRQWSLSFVITTMCWTPWIELDSFQFFLKYSVKGFWNLFAFGIQNPANFRCGIPNPGLWNLEYSRRNPECH